MFYNLNWEVISLIKIALCDDNEMQLDIFKDYIKQYEKNHPHKIKATFFSLGSELINSASNNRYDIYFLDLIMPEITGMEVAKALREKKDKGKIVFLTSSKDGVFDAFSVKASDYILKPISYEKISDKIDELCAELREEKPETITIKADEGSCVVPIGEILYIENRERTPHYVLKDGRTLVGNLKRVKFSSIADEFLNKGFALCNAGTAVNLNNVFKIKKDTGEIRLATGQILYCSRGLVSQFIEKLDALNANN